MTPQSGGGVAAGTLGFFVTLNVETAPKNIGLVACAHVVPEGGNHVGDTYYQPAGRAVGRFSGVKSEKPDGQELIGISPVSLQDATNCGGGNLPFAAKGDSGSALIDAQGRLIGLLYSIDTATQTKGYACYLTPV